METAAMPMNRIDTIILLPCLLVFSTRFFTILKGLLPNTGSYPSSPVTSDSSVASGSSVGSINGSVSISTVVI